MQETGLANIPQQAIKWDLEDPPTEVKKAITQLKHGKAHGIDGLPGEVFMAGGDTIVGKQPILNVLCWEKGVIPQYNIPQ